MKTIALICLFSLAVTMASAASVKDLEMEGWLTAENGNDPEPQSYTEEGETTITTEEEGSGGSSSTVTTPTSTESTTTGAASSVISFTILSACLLAKFIS